MANILSLFGHEVVERINTYSHDCEAILVPGEGRIGSIFH